MCKQTVADMVYACHNRSGRSYIFPSLTSAAPSSLPPFFNLVPSLPLALTLPPSLVLSVLSSSPCHLAPVRFAFFALFFSLLPGLVPFYNLHMCVQMFTASIKGNHSITPFRRQNITIKSSHLNKPNQQNKVFQCFFQHEAFVHVHRLLCKLAQQRPPDK